MIGSATSRSLSALGYSQQFDLSFDWRDPAEREQAHRNIELEVKAIAPEVATLSAVWSAGECAFHSTTEDTAKEMEVFTESVTKLSRLRNELNPRRFRFHFLSSAGGLYEGQRIVDLGSRPEPLRPYGRLKLAQENWLQSVFGREQQVIYRPSSVYGPMLQSKRKGLINNLVNNGRDRRLTVLDAQVMSLRDYVFSHDVGKYVAQCVYSGEEGANGPTERFLVSARCSSIFEVVKKIQHVLNLKLLIRYDEHFGNNRSITFSDRILPGNWNPVSLDVGLRQFLVGAL